MHTLWSVDSAIHMSPDEGECVSSDDDAVIWFNRHSELFEVLHSYAIHTFFCVCSVSSFFLCLSVHSSSNALCMLHMHCACAFVSNFHQFYNIYSGISSFSIVPCMHLFSRAYAFDTFLISFLSWYLVRMFPSIQPFGSGHVSRSNVF